MKRILFLSTTKANIIANYFGQGWQMSLSLLLVPIYIHFIGIEAYALVGIFTMLQSCMALLDMGMKPALNREMAMYSAGKTSLTEVKNLVRSIEIISLAIIFCILVIGLFFSGWFSRNWVNLDKLIEKEVSDAFFLMSIVVGLRFLESIYSSMISGLKRQILLNSLLVFTNSLRGIGTICILAFISSDITTFFIWQAIASLISITMFWWTVNYLIPTRQKGAIFSLTSIKRVWRFTSGMMIINLLSLALSQTDKILLSKILLLKEFGYYTLAGAVAGSLLMMVGPIVIALYPRLTELFSQDNYAELTSTFHKGSQLVSVLVGSSAGFLIFFAESILASWTQDVVLSKSAAPILIPLAIGNLLNACMWMPYHTQLAYGWTSLSIITNIIVLLILVPLIFILTPIYGAIAAAWIWALINGSYVAISVQFMFKRILVTEKRRWYLFDLAFPISAAFITAFFLSLLMPESLTLPYVILYLGIAYGTILFVSLTTAEETRNRFYQIVKKAMKNIRRNSA